MISSETAYSHDRIEPPRERERYTGAYAPNNNEPESYSDRQCRSDRRTWVEAARLDVPESLTLFSERSKVPGFTILGDARDDGPELAEFACVAVVQRLAEPLLEIRGELLG